MCHAGNEGAVKAFNEGILTQASVMVACPWFHEAAELAKEHSIPVGVHLMATAEWDYLRWGPLTGGGSLRTSDGTVPPTIPGLQGQGHDAHLLEEFTAQVGAFLAERLPAAAYRC